MNKNPNKIKKAMQKRKLIKRRDRIEFYGIWEENFQAVRFPFLIKIKIKSKKVFSPCETGFK
jgi:hypothetical protein